MSEFFKRLIVPFVQRHSPTVAPGGIVHALASPLLNHNLGVETDEMVHVTRHEDVREVLTRDDDFSVRLYDRKMTETTGPFYLGMNERERYERDAKIIWQVIRREDAELVRGIAREESERAIAAVRGKGVVDVVKDVASQVPIRVVARYYGSHPADLAHFLSLYQTTSKYLFAFWSEPSMREEAMRSGRETRTALDEMIVKRRANGEPSDADVMGRLLALRDTFHDGDAGIARSIAGLSSGNINAPFGLFVYSIEKLMHLPEARLRAAQELARAAEGKPGESSELQDWLLEAQRFAVYPPFSYRYAERDTTLSKGTSRETAIRQGATVVTWQSLAAFDPFVFDDPFEFLPGRDKAKYNGFGFGRHRCVGEHIGQVMLYEMARALLALPGLRLARGNAGKVQTLPVHAGKYPSSFGLAFDRAS